MNPIAQDHQRVRLRPPSLDGMIVMAHGGGVGTYNRKIDVQLRFTF